MNFNLQFWNPLETSVIVSDAVCMFLCKTGCVISLPLGLLLQSGFSYITNFDLNEITWLIKVTYKYVHKTFFSFKLWYLPVNVYSYVEKWKLRNSQNLLSSQYTAVRLSPSWQVRHKKLPCKLLMRHNGTEVRGVRDVCLFTKMSDFSFHFLFTH